MDMLEPKMNTLPLKLGARRNMKKRERRTTSAAMGGPQNIDTLATGADPSASTCRARRH